MLLCLSMKFYLLSCKIVETILKINELKSKWIWINQWYFVRKLHYIYSASHIWLHWSDWLDSCPLFALLPLSFSYFFASMLFEYEPLFRLSVFGMAANESELTKIVHLIVCGLATLRSRWLISAWSLSTGHFHPECLAILLLGCETRNKVNQSYISNYLLP